MKTEGNSASYSTGSQGIPLPRATSNGVRPTHAPQRRKPTGLDWSAHRAPDAAPEGVDVRDAATRAKKCRNCKRRPGVDAGLCAPCRQLEDQAEKRYVDDTPLGRDLAELERTEPAVAAAADRLDEVLATAKEKSCPTPAPPARSAAPEPPSGTSEPKRLSGAAPASPSQALPAGSSMATPATASSPDVALEAGERITLYDGTEVTIGRRTPVREEASVEVGPRRFVLDRHHDVSGVSGTGVVVEGVRFSDGVVATRWTAGEHRSTVVWASVDDVLEIHGHDGATVLRWLDDEPTPTPAPAAASGPATATTAPRTTEAAAGRTYPTDRRSARSLARDVDLAEVLRRNEAGETPPAIATALKTTPKRIRAMLDDAGVHRVDGRSVASGGKPKDYDQDQVDQVRRLYVDEGMSQGEVGEKLGIGRKVVDTIMRRNGITARAGQTGRMDGARSMKQQMADAGITSLQVKHWAFEQGLISEIARGLPKQHLVDAYLEAHPAGGDE